jgi:integrase
MNRRDRFLEDYPRVQAWWEKRRLRSELTADHEAWKLLNFCDRMHFDPERLVSIASKEPDRLAELIVQFAAEMKRAGRTDAYIANLFGAVRSWFRFRKVTFSDFPDLRPIKGSTLARERVPTPEELGRILDRLSLRGRAIALLMAHTGIRPHVMGNYTGNDGLTLGDLPELDLENLRFREIPFVLQVPARLSKTSKSYLTFGTAQLATTLLSCLADRREKGERLDALSPLIARVRRSQLRGVAKRSSASGGRFAVTNTVKMELAEVLHAAAPPDTRWRPYVLRAYCSTRLMLGPMSRDLREAILGHDGGVASRYNVGKRWGDELLVEARREYAASARLLETNAQTGMSVATEFRKTLLAVAGLSEEEASEHMEDSNEGLLAILREKLSVRESSAQTPADGNGTQGGHSVQRPVTLEEAERLLAQGWTYVANFGPNRVLLQAP